MSGELLGIDAVREFNVLTDTYGAAYGKRSGAQVSVVTQSGGNALHGSLFEFLRNSKLDARNFFDQTPFRRFDAISSAGLWVGLSRKTSFFFLGTTKVFGRRWPLAM